MPVTLQFLRVDKAIRVPSPDTSVTIQEIYDQIQDWLDEPSQMDILSFVSAGGKESLGGGEFVGITMTLTDDWRVEFEPRGGPATIACIVSGGNLVAVNSFSDNPIKPSTFTQIQIRQSQAPTIIETGVSGLTPTESAQLASIDTKSILIEKILRNKTETDPATGIMTVYDDDGSTILFQANIWEDIAATIPYDTNSERIDLRERLE